MRRVLLANDQTLRLVRVPGEAGVFSFLEHSSPADARRYLEEYAGDAMALWQMRMALAEDSLGLDVSRLDDPEVLDEVALRVSLGHLTIAEELEEPLPEITEPEAASSSAAAPPPPLPRSKKLTWIEVKVVWDSSGKPVANVRLVIRTPEGEEKFHDTNAEGKARVEEIEQGTCDVRCELKAVKRETTLIFVGGGEPAKPQEEATNGKKVSGTLVIAQLENHKVKKGESLDGLAKKVGMTWKDLAKFNWGTDQPEKINEHLRYDVGCTKKTADGKNLIFDDKDDPGLVEMPKPWSVSGLSTGQTHVLRVGQSAVSPPWYFSV
ncbi:MAG TPA: LysM peptidoglycan-binding domain-containing protein [Tepidisphaeraceae bacterium]|jgi:LysM repeat protein|nr:LysM peptidoglycan-binding domain-containing protein [Tepidisphaeraceae bacterium]